MLRSTCVRVLGLGAFFAVAASAACQVLAGIDEKTAAVVVPDAQVADVTTGPECTTNAQCIAAHSPGYVCVKETSKCQSLFSTECDTVLAGSISAGQADKQAIYANDDTLFLGFVMDLKGEGKQTGIARRQAVALAIDAIANNHGIPGGAEGRRRPVAVVACSETKDDGTIDPTVAARHLVDELHVPAIIGASNSDTSSALFYNAAFPNALVFAPNALSSRLSLPTDNGLFWRTSASDPAQARALQQQINAVEQDLVTNQGVSSGDARLAIVYLDDGFGTDIVPQITGGLTWNGAALGVAPNGATCTSAPCDATARVLVRPYSDVTDNGKNNVAGELKFFKPNLVVAIGGGDAVTIASKLEGLLADDFAPTYLFAQGSATSDLTTILTPTPGDGGLRKRIRGVRQLLAADEATTFAGQYNLAFPAGPPDTLGVPGAYDITYLLAYAAVAAAGNAGTALTAARLNDGLKRVLDPDASAVYRTTPDTVGPATDTLNAGTSINVKGYSYTNGFDLDAGEAPARFEVYCVASTGGALRSSGLVYDPALDGGTTTGTFSCPSQ